MDNKNKSWRTYEKVACYLLSEMSDQFNLHSFQGKQKLKGKYSGTEWEIDAKGVSENDELFIIVECRRHTTSRLTQEDIAAIAYRIRDTGASGGIIVSPLGLQRGVEKVARAEKVHSIKLDSKSTTTEYVLQFLNEIRVGLVSTIAMTDSVSAEIISNNQD